MGNIKVYYTVEYENGEVSEKQTTVDTASADTFEAVMRSFIREKVACYDSTGAKYIVVSLHTVRPEVED